MDISTFGESLRVAREARGLSPEELADLAGCSSTNIRKIERIGQMPRVDLAHRLLQALDRRMVIGAERSRKRFDHKG